MVGLGIERVVFPHAWVGLGLLDGDLHAAHWSGKGEPLCQRSRYISTSIGS